MILSTIKRLLGCIIFYFVDFWATKPTKATIQKSLLLVRVDVLGDYILFRNFIEDIKHSPQYSGYKITFCGNLALKEFVEFFDGDLIDDFIWLDRDRFAYSIPYRFSILRRISTKGFNVAINAQYSREFFHGDALIKASNATTRIGSSGDLNNLERWQKCISDRYYTWLIPAEHGTLFEFYRNRDFFEKLLNTKIDTIKPCLYTENIPPANLSSQNYIVIHPGARLKFRQWAPEKFAAIADFISVEYGLDIIIVGSKDEISLSRELISNTNIANIIDLSGKTNLIQLAKIISEAKLFLGNDTGTAHISVSVNTPTVVISNCNHFGRYIPYPNEVFNKVYTVFPKFINETTEHTEDIYEQFKYCSNININTIAVNDVKKNIVNIMNTN